MRAAVGASFVLVLGLAVLHAALDEAPRVAARPPTDLPIPTRFETPRDVAEESAVLRNVFRNGGTGIASVPRAPVPAPWPRDFAALDGARTRTQQVPEPALEILAAGAACALAAARSVCQRRPR